MAPKNFAFCNECKQIVPATHVERDNKVYLSKECPKCGTNEYLVSSDASLYNKKRGFMQEAVVSSGCGLLCPNCTSHKKPDIIFIDVTNRCNMNCLICLNNLAAMGYKFEPRMEYFDRIFKHYSTYDVKPYVQLFGGEPTMRADLFDIIKLGKSYGLSIRVITNGLKLADKKYCDDLMDLGVMIHIAFDGLNKAMYEKLRGRADALDLKLKALDNLAARKRGKVILMTVVDKEQNASDMAEFFKFSQKNLHVVRGIYFMPLIHTWDKKALDYNPERTTLEDVEYMVNETIEGGNVEFVPLGSLSLKNLYRALGIRNMPFVGVHPNCESITYLVSDGTKFVSASKFLKTSLYRFIGDLRGLEIEVSKKYAGKKPGPFGKAGICLKALGIAAKHVNFGALVGSRGPTAYMKWLGIFGKMIIGRKAKDVLREDTLIKGALQILILPLEDLKTAEAERLVMCSSCFAYVDPDTDEIRTLPTCTWDNYKKPIMKKVAEKFNVR
ncbi:MAG: radical SAM protein [Candidatus Omnitrophica bacterium]|nr:radical SAM protein [Candidatus Omnitrophota bacterium]